MSAEADFLIRANVEVVDLSMRGDANRPSETLLKAHESIAYDAPVRCERTAVVSRRDAALGAFRAEQ
jgi:hypothetical protein